MTSDCAPATTPGAPCVTYTEVPADLRTARRLRGWADRDGVIVVEPLLGADGRVTTAELASAVLSGMGKSWQLLVLKRSPEPLAQAWLCGLGASTAGDGRLPLVVILEAQTIPAEETEQLLRWLDVARLSGVFVFTVLSRNQRVQALELNEHPARTVLETTPGIAHLERDQFYAEVMSRPECTKSDPLADPAPGSVGWQVPRVDGVQFRSGCRALLSPEDFAAVDELFVRHVGRTLAAFDACVDTSPVRGRSTVIRQAIESAASTEELVVVVRAAQVACVLSGYQMSVDTPRLVAAAEVLCRRGLAGPQDWWGRLAAYVDPDPGALAALWWLGVDPDRSVPLALGDIIPVGSGARITVGGVELEVDGSVAQCLVAQRTYRLICGAAPGDPLFSTFRGPGMAASTASRMLHQVTTELGVDLVEDIIPKGGLTAKAYLARYGITLTKVMKAPNGLRTRQRPAPKRGGGRPSKGVDDVATGTAAARRIRTLVLDPEVVHERRRELRLSTSALAACTGTSAGVIIRIEKGHDQGKLDLRLVVDLARALGVAVSELIVGTSPSGPLQVEPSTPGADVQTLGSMLSTASGWVGIDELCDATGWDLSRVQVGLSGLETGAGALGLGLAWAGWDVALVPATIIKVPNVKPAGNRQGVNIDACRLLYRLTLGQSENQLRRESPEARRRLITVGLARNAGDKHDPILELTEEARFNLCLDEF